MTATSTTEPSPFTREITSHHDGFGLNETIKLEADAKGNGGASHHFRATIDGASVLDVQFQNGARVMEGSTPGITTQVMLAILIDQLEGFQSGEFANDHGEIALSSLRIAKKALHMRTADRAERGVLGRNER